MAVQHLRKPFSPALMAQTRHVWQGYYDVPLTDEDAGVITGNMVEFFEVLREWDRTSHDS